MAAGLSISGVIVVADLMFRWLRLRRSEGVGPGFISTSPASKIRRVRKRQERFAETRTKLKRRVEDFRKKTNRYVVK